MIYAAILTCAQAQIILARVEKRKLPQPVKEEVAAELRLMSPKNCKTD